MAKTLTIYVPDEKESVLVPYEQKAKTEERSISFIILQALEERSSGKING